VSFTGLPNFFDIPGNPFIIGRNQCRAKPGHPGRQEVPADADQVVSAEIRVVKINAGESVYLNVDEAGCYPDIFIRQSLIVAG
jgi:hypothetical protein